MAGPNDEREESRATLNVDFSGVSGTWCLAYLLLPSEDRELAMRATALNFLSTSDGLPKDWEKEFPKVLACMRQSGDSVNNVSTFSKNKPSLSIVSPDDITG